MDYSEGKIYRIINNINGDVYYGSTKETYIKKRLTRHEFSFNKWLKDGLKYCSSYEILIDDDYYIELVEHYPCKSKDELKAREGWYIKNNKCVNSRKEGEIENFRDLSKYEYHKRWTEINKEAVDKSRKKWAENNPDYLMDYVDKNKEKISNYQKEYRLKNKEKIAEQKKEYAKLKKDEIAARKKKKVICEICGGKYSWAVKKRHEQSQKHLSAI